MVFIVQPWFCFVWEKERVSLSSKVPIISRIHVHCSRFLFFFFLTRIKIKQGEELYVPPLLNKWTKNKTLEVSELLKKKIQTNIWHYLKTEKLWERKKTIEKKPPSLKAFKVRFEAWDCSLTVKEINSAPKFS